jgi:hypothetical protein
MPRDFDAEAVVADARLLERLRGRGVRWFPHCGARNHEPSWLVQTDGFGTQLIGRWCVLIGTNA